MRIDAAALEVMAERQAKHVWYGDPDLVAEIYARARGGQEKCRHPLNRSAAVIRALAVSSRFKRMGKIQHRGTWYSVYKPVGKFPWRFPDTAACGDRTP